jgi:hypothetical protein
VWDSSKTIAFKSWLMSLAVDALRLLCILLQTIGTLEKLPEIKPLLSLRIPSIKQKDLLEGCKYRFKTNRYSDATV